MLVAGEDLERRRRSPVAGSASAPLGKDASDGGREGGGEERCKGRKGKGRVSVRNGLEVGGERNGPLVCPLEACGLGLRAEK